MIAVDTVSGAMATMIGRCALWRANVNLVMTTAGIVSAVMTRAATPMSLVANANQVMTTAGIVSANRATITAADAKRK
jgi:hypothetical protein